MDMDTSDRLLICVNAKFELSVYSLNALLQPLNPTDAQVNVVRVSLVEPIFEGLKLFKQAKLFDFSAKTTKTPSLLSYYNTHEEEKQANLDQLERDLLENLKKMDADLFQLDSRAVSMFRFQKNTNTLYTFLEQENDNIFLKKDKQST